MTGTSFSVKGQRVLVVGAARSGVAAALLLVRRGAAVTLTDRKPAIADRSALDAAGVALELGAHHAGSFAGTDLVVLSPGVPVDLPELSLARAAGVPVIGELELASRWVRGPLVAITGTKGKSTTTTLVGRMLEAAGKRVLVGGNIGVPLSAQVESSTDDTVHVVEASSFQLEATDRFHPKIAALLNFSPDHLDRHPSVAAYAAAKQRVFANQTAEDWAVVNAESAEAVELARMSRARQVRYALGGKAGADVFTERGFIWQRTSDGDVPLVPLSAVRLAGTHLLSNVAAASAISSLAGADPGAMQRALVGFTGLEHVMEPVATVGGVRFVNDSKATNVDAARAIDRKLLLGGRHPRRQVQGRRPARSGRPARRAWPGGGRHRRGAAADSGGARRHAPGGRGGVAGRGGAARLGARATGRRGAAGAGVLELRHVRGLRGPRTAVQGGSAAARRGRRGDG